MTRRSFFKGRTMNRTLEKPNLKKLAADARQWLVGIQETTAALLKTDAEIKQRVADLQNLSARVMHDYEAFEQLRERIERWLAKVEGDPPSGQEAA